MKEQLIIFRGWSCSWYGTTDLGIFFTDTCTDAYGTTTLHEPSGVASLWLLLRYIISGCWPVIIVRITTFIVVNVYANCCMCSTAEFEAADMCVCVLRFVTQNILSADVFVNHINCDMMTVCLQWITCKKDGYWYNCWLFPVCTFIVCCILCV